MKRVIGILLGLAVLAGCNSAPQEDLKGGVIMWQSDDGKQRIVQTGPCVKAQTQSNYDHTWYTTHTDCTPAGSPVR